MQKYLKIVAIVLFLVGLAAFALVAAQYPKMADASKRVEDSYANAAQAVSEAKAAIGTDKEAITKKEAERQLGYVDYDLKELADVKRAITITVAGGIVSVVVGVVLWFVSRKKGDGSLQVEVT